MKHDLLKRLQEIFLKVETCELFLDQEFICQLSQWVNGKDWDIEVLVGAYVDEVLTKHLPDPRPDESDSGHVQICDFHEGLKTELSCIDWVIQLLSRNFAEILNEHNDGILV